MPIPSRLQRLTLVPSNGLCNRLRAIASARRLCANLAARCFIVWDWGEYSSFFEPSSDIRVLRHPCDLPDIVITHHQHHIERERTIDVTVRNVRVHSAYIFWGSHESPIKLQDVMPFFPALNARLRNVVDAFCSAHLQNAIGFHIRRADNHQSANQSPDAIFLQIGQKLVAGGKNIFLATDNLATEDLLKRSLGDAVITYPKRQRLEWRWPRPFNPTATEDDLIDLHLLARTQYVLGSFWSSYSRVAIALNGCPRSRILDRYGGANRLLRLDRLIAGGRWRG